MGNKNKLMPENVGRILQAYIDRKEEPHFSALVKNADIAANSYNISVSSYVEQEDTREAIDIAELNRRIAGIVARQSTLRTAIDEIIADLE